MPRRQRTVRPSSGPSHTIAPSSPAWDGAWLEWGLRHDDVRREARGTYAFVAGVTFHKNVNVAGDDPRHQQWLVARLDRGFEQVRHDQLPRLWSYRYPEQLLIASTFEKQAELLADWVLERFDAVTLQSPDLERVGGAGELGT